tara:strand:- start:35223 stop:36992 length:1770 start_codon:yes stop_codon:yes gene_type:complete
MRGLNLINLLTTLILIISVNEIKAEEATTGNLLPNAGDGQSSFQNTQDSHTPDKVGSGSGFTIDSGIQAFQNELEAKGTGNVTANGSLVGITTEKENGGQFNITADSLDGGVSLNSLTEVQNCEWLGSTSRCGSATAGADSYKTILKILDDNNNVLATTSITRNNDAGYGVNSYTYSDTIAHNGTGARKWDWQWQGIDGNNTSATASVGPNLLGASLTATLADINFQQLTEEQSTNISSANTQIEESQTALTEVFKDVQQFKPEVNIEIAPRIERQEVKIEEFKAPAIEMKKLETMVIEQFKQIIVKENLVQEFNTALVEENITEEQFFEEVGNMMKEELNVVPEPKVKEPKMEENNVVAKKSNLEEETIKEEPKVKGEPKVENEPKKEESNASNSTEPKPETTKENETSSENEPEESENTEEKSNESSMDEDTETEGEETKKTNEEKLDADETGTTKETDVDSGDEKSIASSISAKVEKIIKKLENTLMTVDQKVKAVQFITLRAMSDEAPDMSSYKNQSFYSSTQLPDGNVDFFNQLNIEQTQIYTGVTLAKYTDNDPLTSQRVELDRIKTEETRLQIELKQLREQL